eukprot:1141193-Pelagomonas_calceolata.AAC.7
MWASVEKKERKVYAGLGPHALREGFCGIYSVWTLRIMHSTTCNAQNIARFHTGSWTAKATVEA